MNKELPKIILDYIIKLELMSSHMIELRNNINNIKISNKSLPKHITDHGIKIPKHLYQPKEIKSNLETSLYKLHKELEYFIEYLYEEYKESEKYQHIGGD